MPSYYEKQYAQFKAAAPLLEHRWTLYGYRSEVFEVHDWIGVAERDGWVLCVWVTDDDVESHSGQDDTRDVWTQGAPCPKCDGTGVWPGGLTYDEALQDPGQQHYFAYMAECDRTFDPRQIIMSEDVVSNQYFEDGRPKCCYCSGSGFQKDWHKELVCAWPVFQATPPRKAWHLERDGVIVASGLLPSKKWKEGRGSQEDALEEWAAKLDKLTAA